MGALIFASGQLTTTLAAETNGALAFLSENGFTRVSSTESKVRYESSKVHLEVTYSRHDGEVAITFGRIAKNEEYSFALFLRLVNPKRDLELGERLVESQEQLRDCLYKLAQALREDGRPILEGDELLFERIKRVR